MLSGSTSHDHLLQGIELHNHNAASRHMEVSRDFTPPNGQRVDMGQIMNVVSENRRMKQLLVCVIARLACHSFIRDSQK
jgi:hypothetical protein